MAEFKFLAVHDSGIAAAGDVFYAVYTKWIFDWLVNDYFADCHTDTTGLFDIWQ